MFHSYGLERVNARGLKAVDAIERKLIKAASCLIMCECCALLMHEWVIGTTLPYT